MQRSTWKRKFQSWKCFCLSYLADMRKHQRSPLPSQLKVPFLSWIPGDKAQGSTGQCLRISSAKQLLSCTAQSHGVEMGMGGKTHTHTPQRLMVSLWVLLTSRQTFQLCVYFFVFKFAVSSSLSLSLSLTFTLFQRGEQCVKLSWSCHRNSQ